MHPQDNEPIQIRVLRTLGRGRAATARLVEATMPDGRTETVVEKVFLPGILTRSIYRICFWAPFAYRDNHDAISTAFYRRRVAAEVLKETGVRVAMPRYVRRDRETAAWILGAEWVQGRGIRPAATRRGPIHGRAEIQDLIEQMTLAREALIDAGLGGSGWQIDPRAMVSTANLLRVGDRYVVIDLESGIPAILVPRYLFWSARRGTLPPFDDVDADQLRARGLERRDDVEALIRHDAAWKSAEPSPLRVSSWRRWRGIARVTLRRAWRFVCEPERQTAAGIRTIVSAIDRWEAEHRIDATDADALRDELDGDQLRAYARGFGLHLATKSIVPIVAPAKYGGTAAALATGQWLFLLPWLLLPGLRTLISVANAVASGRGVRHREAIAVGWIPTIGSAAFPVQIFVVRRQLATFLIRDAASRLGRRLPIYGGKDSRTEIAMIGWADRLVRCLDRLLAEAPNRYEKTLGDHRNQPQRRAA